PRAPGRGGGRLPHGDRAGRHRFRAPLPGKPPVPSLGRVITWPSDKPVLRIDKGDAKSGLNAAREEILRRHVTRPGYRVVDIPEPPRDRSPSLAGDAYQDAG